MKKRLLVAGAIATAVVAGRIARHRRVLHDAKKVIQTKRGKATMVLADGPYVGVGIYVTLPKGVVFSDQMADAFSEAAKGQLCMSRPQGGGNTTVLITADLDHWKPSCSQRNPAPRLEEVAELLGGLDF